MIVQTNFIKGRMNKSVDERLVPLGEYVDALNVRLGSTETTEIGAVENSKEHSSHSKYRVLGQSFVSICSMHRRFSGWNERDYILVCA